MSESCARELVKVSWLDSARPEPGWHFLDEAPALVPVVCESVGWVVGETADVVMLAPNLGDLGADSAQACGFMRIPARAITRRVRLTEAP